MDQRDCNEVEFNILRQYKSISETNKENFSIVSSYVYFTRANFKIRLKISQGFFHFSLHHSLNTRVPRHFSSPISTVGREGRGASSLTNNSKTRSIISDSHHDRTIFPRGMVGQRYSRQYRGAIESRYLVHGAAVCFVRCCCRVPAPFWQRDASGGTDTRELEKPAARFRPDNAVIDKLCGRIPAVGSNRYGGDLLLAILLRFFELLFRNIIVFLYIIFP